MSMTLHYVVREDNVTKQKKKDFQSSEDVWDFLRRMGKSVIDYDIVRHRK